MDFKEAFLKILGQVKISAIKDDCGVFMDELFKILKTLDDSKVAITFVFELKEKAEEKLKEEPGEPLMRAIIETAEEFLKEKGFKTGPPGDQPLVLD